MPRKSAAELQLAGTAHQLDQRPAPSPDLTDIQRVLWVQIANALPVDWFGEENKALLAAYCRTLSTMAFLDRQIDEMESAPDNMPMGVYFDLVKRRESYARLQLSQATKMRLTQQSRYGKYQAATAVDKPRAPATPWQFK